MADDYDEFASVWTEGLDAESLAQVELMATQQAASGPSYSQAQERTRDHRSSSRLSPLKSLKNPEASRSIQPPAAKRQKLDLADSKAGPQSRQTTQPVLQEDEEETPVVYWTDGKYHTRASSQKQPQVLAPGDFEVRHTGPGRPPALGAGAGESLQNRELLAAADDWDNDDMDDTSWDQVEEQAIRLSQHQQPEHSGRGTNKARELSPHRPSASTSRLGIGKSNGLPQKVFPKPQLRPEPANNNADEPPSAATTSELQALRQEMEDMKSRLTSALAESKENKNKMYSRDGEIKMVRQRQEKAERELAEMRIQAQKKQEEFQKQLDEREKQYLLEKDRTETTAAFHRLEHETSAKRTVWPGSARRRLPQNRGASQVPHGFSQQAAPPIAPTTPTKRSGRFADLSPSGHRSGGSQTRSPRSGGVEDSPSKRLAGKQAAVAANGAARPASSVKPKKPTFAGFENSFAAPDPSARKTPKSNRQVFNDATTEDVMMQGDDPIMMDISAEPVTRPEAAVSTGPAISVETLVTESRRRRHLLALSAFSRRRTGIVVLLLSHVAVRPLAPLTLPSSRYLEAAITGPELSPDHPSTMHRLFDMKLPSGTHAHLQSLHRSATDLLLEVLTEGASMTNVEGRFAFLHKLPPDLPAADDKVALTSLEESDYWDCQDAMDEGMQDILDDLTTALRSLMGIFLRLCMMDALQDVMSLMTALAISEPMMINSLMANEVPFDLQTARMEDSLAGNTQAESQTQNELSLPPPPIPTRVTSCLIETVRKSSRPISLTLSSPESLVVEREQAPPPTATQSRWARAKAKKDADVALSVPWDMGETQRRATLASVVALLEVLIWHLGIECGRYLKDIFEAPGFIATLLDDQRTDASTMRQFVQLLTQVGQYPDCWKRLVACRFDPDLQPDLPSLITRSRTPLLELLARHLVDLRQKQTAADAHRLHVSIVILLSQLCVKHPDAALLARESKSLFAALIQSIHTDTSAIWNEDQEVVKSGEGDEPDGSTYHKSSGSATFMGRRPQDLVRRLIMDVHLLSRIFASDAYPDDLVERLNSHESHLLLNGIRHCFILSFSRLAFADEPRWMKEDVVRDLQNGCADRCSDLLEMVLNPDEVEEAWEICNGEEEDEEEAEAEAEAESQTQSQTQGGRGRSAKTRGVGDEGEAMDLE